MRPVWLMGKCHASLRTGKECVVAMGDISTLSIPLLQMPELSPQKAGLDGIEPAIVAFNVVEIFFRLAMVTQQPAGLSQLFIIGCNSAGLPASAQVLARIEAERRRMAHGPGLAPTVFLLREILRALGLARIFNHFKIVLGGQIKNRVHIGHLPIKMYRNDYSHRIARSLVEGPLRARIP